MQPVPRDDEAEGEVSGYENDTQADQLLLVDRHEYLTIIGSDQMGLGAGRMRERGRPDQPLDGDERLPPQR